MFPHERGKTNMIVQILAVPQIFRLYPESGWETLSVILDL